MRCHGERAGYGLNHEVLFLLVIFPLLLTTMAKPTAQQLTLLLVGFSLFILVGTLWHLLDTSEWTFTSLGRRVDHSAYDRLDTRPSAYRRQRGGRERVGGGRAGVEVH